MNLSLLLVGLAKIAFGVIVGAFGIFLGNRMVNLLTRRRDSEEQLGRGNLAIGILEAASLLSLGILVQHAVQATFDAMDLLHRDHAFTTKALMHFCFYGAVHVGVALLVGAIVIALGTALFNRLTAGVDEMREVRAGNSAPALVLAAVIVVLALVTAPGLRTTLDGLLPIPELQRDVLPMPS
jgi:uncharacterized membrane protein YjfL (UPF0719 family)